MKTKDLKPGKDYLYNGNSVLVKVRYNGNCKEGHSFTERGRKGETHSLSAKEVDAYIES
ncbi:hypothetical protein [Dysgonomonas termitidis]|uniref:Uncharacterized protein n=1 Tax=Dysgonomonas termitidis TaxID=1516126 RepID=A0ABV9KV88_9BACT